MKHTFITLLLIMLAASIAFAQDNPLEVPNNLFGGPEATDNGIVGAIGGTVDVSALGGATYTIPILMPEGINGIQPNLSIVYNSQSGDGLLGWGWNLGGLSAITRTGKTLYYDNTMDGVDFRQDRFLLDGQRLMEVNGKYGENGTEYRTEVDGMTKIVSFAEDGISPSYFQVWFANGTIAYYGNSPDSKVMLQEEDNVCVWLLKRLEDRDGDYMTYHYNTGGAHYYLESIKYTGNSNAGFGPMFIVKFNYEPRSSENVEMSFIGKNDLKMNVLLKSIEIKKWKKEDYIPALIKYNFKHFARKDSNGSFGRYIYDRLDAIECSYFDNNYTPAKEYKFNPTKIIYGEYPSIYNGSDSKTDLGERFSDGYLSSIDITGGGWNEMYQGQMKFPGDFNGDGLTDFISVYKYEGQETMHMQPFINKGNNLTDNTPGCIRFEKQSQSIDFTDSHVDWIYVCDFNGDGLDDFYLVSCVNYGVGKTIRIFACKSTVASDGTWSYEELKINNEDYYYFNTGVNREYAVLTGDFMGRGKNDMILINEKYFGGYDWPYYFEYSDDGSNCSIQCEQTGYHISGYSEGVILPIDKYATGDYNGDGRTEIWCSNEEDEKTFIYSVIKEHYLYPEEQIFYSFDFIEQLWDADATIYSGDFNGDGITDFLAHQGTNWYVKICGNPSTNQYYDYTYEIDKLKFYAANGTPPYFGHEINDITLHIPYYITVADINGDGKSDVVILNPSGEFHVLYGPVYQDSSNGSKGHFSAHDYYPASLVGLPNITINDYYSKCVGNFLGQENQSVLESNILSFPPISTYYGVKSITDGMGNTTEFDFGYLVNNPHENAENIYTLTKNCENNGNDIYAVSLPIKAVKKLTSYNKHDEKPVKSISEYTYSGILLHRKGKGLLGLSANTVESYLEFAPYHDYTERTYNTTAMGRHCAVTPSTEKTFLKKRDTGTLLRTSETEFEYDKHVHSHNDLVYMPLLTSQITDLYDIDILRNGEPSFLKRTISKTETTFYYDLFRYKRTEVGTTTDRTIGEPILCEFYTDKYLPYDNDESLWLVDRVANIDETVIQNGDGMLLYEDIIHYDDINGKPHRIKDIEHFPWQGYLSQYATKTEYTYNEIGKVETEVLSAINDPDMPERKTEYIYNGWRQLNTKREWLDGNIYYDTKFEYDPFFEFVTAETNCRGQKTKYERDPLGIDRITHFPDGTMTHTQTGWLDGKPGYYEWSQSSGNAPVMSYYDLKGVKQKTETCGFSSSQLITKNYNYNDLGQLESEEDPHLNGEAVQLTKFNYDNYGRLFKTDFPNGTSQETVSDAENGFKIKTILHTPNEGNHETWQETNAIGWVTFNWDEKGIPVSYEYYADGLLKTATVNNDPNTSIKIEYDEARNRTKLHDPDYCGPNEDKCIVNTYDSYGQQKTTTTPKGDVTTYEYDGFGRTIKRIEENYTTGQKDITNYVYHNSDDFKGLLKEVNFNGNQEITEYTYYDDTRKLNKVTETINGNRYSPTIYHYNENGKIDRIKYSSGFEVQKEYTITGHLKVIRDAKNNRLWETKEKNGQGQITEFNVGREDLPFKGSYQYYPNTHYLEAQKITNFSGDLVQHFWYKYDKFGNLARRTTDKYWLGEDFLYDEMNRLTTSTVTYHNPNYTYTSAMTYDDIDPNGTSQLGCMVQKTAAWEGAPSFNLAVYGGNGRPHALAKADMNNDPFPTNKQETEYTAFDKLSCITQYDDNGDNKRSLTYTYGQEHQRIAMVEDDGTTEIRSKTYIGNCEYIYDGKRKHILTYLTGPLGVFAVYEQISDLYKEDDKGISAMHYIFTDHLGSITTIANEKGVVEQELSYDAWGNIRDPKTWCSSFNKKPMFDRGFTGHEHLYEFGLINMNGRMYDPVMNTFLSVDNYVQSPTCPQGFNRYAYCMYNPLRYIDPSGEFLTWSIGTSGFGVGINFSPAGYPLGVGINVSWANGGSIGLYGEVAYRVGGNGLGAGVGVQQSLEYNFVSGGSTTSTLLGYGSFGCLTAGGSGSYSYSFRTNAGCWGWNVNAGVGLGRSDGNLGGGLSVSFGSGGWTFGANGYYNKMQKANDVIEGQVSVIPDDSEIPPIFQDNEHDCLQKVMLWQDLTLDKELTDARVNQIYGYRVDGDDGGSLLYATSKNYQINEDCGLTSYSKGSNAPVPDNICDIMYDNIKSGGRVIVGYDTSYGHAVGVKSMTKIVHTNIWGKNNTVYKIIVMNPTPGRGYVPVNQNIIPTSRGVSLFYWK